MEQAGDLWKPLIGQLVWSVHRGMGTFLTMEFGSPHLSVREPVSVTLDHTARVLRNLRRRRVYIVGDWHFWVQYSDWKLSTAGAILEHRSPIGSPLDECLNDLDGQRLLSVEAGSGTNSWVFKFDCGGVLETWPSTEIPDTQWSLHSWNGDIAAYQSDGALIFEKIEAS